MKPYELAKKLEGIHTIESIMSLLDVKRSTAIKDISILRKEGYVKTRYANKLRVYYIYRQNRIKGKSYYDIINENSPIKIVESDTYKIYGREPSLEETLVFAIKTRKLRVILAALALFKHIHDWATLLHLAKKESIKREVGALYDLSRKFMKIRKMGNRFRQNALPLKEDKYAHIMPKLESKDFKDIQKLWKVYLPFNSADLEDYKRL